MKIAVLLFLLNVVYGQDMNVTFKVIKKNSKQKNYAIDVSYPQVDFGPGALMGIRGVAADINNTLDTFITGQIEGFIATASETSVKMEGATNELDIKSSVTNKANSLLSIL